MNATVLSWGRQLLRPADISGKLILEAGSYDVNGSIRQVILPLKPKSYVGIDLRMGLGVDLVCDVHNLVTKFGSGCFDGVIACSLLSHIQDWRSAISNLKRVCQPGGFLFIVTVARWQYRTYDDGTGDYWRFKYNDLRRLFSDFSIRVLREENPTKHSLICLKARKPLRFREADLTGYQLTSAQSESSRWGHVHYRSVHPV